MIYKLIRKRGKYFFSLFALGRSCVYLYQSQMNTKAGYCIQMTEIRQLIIICYDNNNLFVINSARSYNWAI